MRGTPREIVLAEVEFMLDAGQAPARIAQALGILPDSVAKSLWRSNRPDLAVKFEQTRSRRHQKCVDCGTRTSDPRHPRCRKCGCAHREANRNRKDAA